MEIVFKATVMSKSIVHDPQGIKSIKLEIVEEREIPPPIIYSPPESEIAREVAPIIKQVMQAMPFARAGKMAVPRVMLWLSEDEWERLYPKPDIGDEVIVKVAGGKIEVSTA